jgi:hypothetical protein
MKNEKFYCAKFSQIFLLQKGSRVLNVIFFHFWGQKNLSFIFAKAKKIFLA